VRVLTALGFAVMLVASLPDPSHSAAFRHVWSRMLAADGRVDFPIFLAFEKPRLVAAGSEGDCFVLVEANKHVSFGGAQLGPGLVLARLDAGGNEMWSVPFTAASRIGGIAAASDGSVVIVGRREAGSDALVVKLDAEGGVIWQKSFGDRFDQMASAVAIAANGDVIVTGYNQGVVDFGGGPVRSNGSYDVFLIRLAGSDGSHIWSHGYGQTGQQMGEQVAVGGDGRIVFTCSLPNGGIDVGGGQLTPSTGGGVVLAMMDENGVYQWGRLMSNNEPQDLVVDNHGNTYLCGAFPSMLETGGDVLTAEPDARHTGYCVSYGPGGEYRWSLALSDSLFSNGEQLALDGEGNCLLLVTKEHGLNAAAISLPASGMFLVNLNAASGTPLSAGAFGARGGFFNACLATNGDRVFLLGYTDKIIDLGGVTLSPNNGLTSVFVGRLDIRRAPRVTISNLSARVDDSDVELKWNIASGEALASYYLTRRIDGSAQAQVISSAPAADGSFTFVDDAAKPGHVNRYELTVETALGDPVQGSVSINVPSLPTSLAQNTPNPFNPLTTFTYTLAQPARVSIAIFDLSGALVCRMDQGSQPAGRHQAQWAGHNWSGNAVSSGVYFYRLEGAGEVPARKMILLK